MGRQVDRDGSEGSFFVYNKNSALSLDHQRQRLPIAKSREAILYLVETHATTIVVGHTGCGKTTQIPQVRAAIQSRSSTRRRVDNVEHCISFRWFQGKLLQNPNCLGNFPLELTAPQRVFCSISPKQDGLRTIDSLLAHNPGESLSKRSPLGLPRRCGALWVLRWATPSASKKSSHRYDSKYCLYPQSRHRVLSKFLSRPPLPSQPCCFRVWGEVGSW